MDSFQAGCKQGDYWGGARVTETNEKLKNYIEIVCQQVKRRHVHTLIRLGDPLELGRTFQHIHRTRIDWLIVGVVVALTALGMLLAGHTSASSEHGYASFSSVHVLVGIGLGAFVGPPCFTCLPIACNAWHPTF